MSKIIHADFGGQDIQFRDDGWFNATTAASKYGKEPAQWLRLPGTAEYMQALSASISVEITGLVKAKRGATVGTWLHPDLAVEFARWLDVKFSIWCNGQIRALIAGASDWTGARLESKAEFRNVVEMLAECRALDGKDTERHHYINESRLLRYAFTGDNAAKWSRDDLSAADLKLLGKVERLDMRLIARGASYDDRKVQCRALVMQSRGQMLGGVAA